MNIRWANEDPNPAAQRKEESKTVLQLALAVEEKRQQEDPLYAYGDPNSNSNNPQEGGEEVGTLTSNILDNFPSNRNPDEYPNTDSHYQKQQANYYSNSTQIISDWLKELGMSQYEHSILSYYVDLQSISQLDEIGLDAVGITNLEHRKKLLSGVDKLVTQYQQQEQEKEAEKQQQQLQQQQQQSSYQYEYQYPPGYDYSSYYSSYYQQQQQPTQTSQQPTEGYYYNAEYTGADPNEEGNAYPNTNTTTNSNNTSKPKHIPTTTNRSKPNNNNNNNNSKKSNNVPSKLVEYDSDE